NSNCPCAWDGTNWAQLNPSTPPPADSGDYYSMAYDDSRQQVVLVYSWPSPARTFIWDGVDWSEKNPETRPSRRQQTVMAYDPNLGRVILFGGNNGAGNDTWSWDGTNWFGLSPASVPSARGASAMVLDSARRQLVLFSGDNQVADTWVWDGATW